MNNLALQSNSTSLTTGFTHSLFDDFLCFIDVTEKSRQTYTRALKQFFRYLALNGINAPMRDDVVNFREDLKKEHKATTVQSYMVVVRLFFRWAEQVGAYKNIADHLKGAKISREHKKDCLTTKQVKRVLAGMERTTEQEKRDYAIMTLMLTGGLRTIEVSRADLQDIRPLGDDTVLYIQGKGRHEKTDYVKLPAPVEDAIRDYLKVAGSSDAKAPLFRSTSNNSKGGRLSTRTISGIVKDCLRNAGFDSDRLTAHSLRHTTGTLNLKNGGTLEETQQLLRHANINTTMTYLHHLQRANNNSEERVAKAIF